MLDIAWTEMLVIAVLLIVVVGPKDLPRVMRTVGQFTRKARAMAREFRGGLDELVREAELEDLRKQAEELKKYNPKTAARNIVDPDGSISDSMQGNFDLPTGPKNPPSVPKSDDTEQGPAVPDQCASPKDGQ